MLKNKKTLLLLLSTVTLAVIAIATAWILYQRSQEGAVAPTAPKSKPSASQTICELVINLNTSGTPGGNSGGSQSTAPAAPGVSTPTPTSVGAPAATATSTPTPTNPAPTATATPTPTLAPGTTATPTPTRAPGTTATPTPTRGLAAKGGATATPTNVSTSSALPQAGFNLPSVLFLGAGAFIVMLGILLLAL